MVVRSGKQVPEKKKLSRGYLHKQFPLRENKSKGRSDLDAATHYVRLIFEKETERPGGIERSEMRANAIYPHVTCALDTKLVEKVFHSIVQGVLTQSLLQSGLI